MNVKGNTQTLPSLVTAVEEKTLTFKSWFEYESVILIQRLTRWAGVSFSVFHQYSLIVVFKVHSHDFTDAIG